ncbi:MAG: bifunctional diaminohydroxyphosphoribosylaminopyrimidine deaminase/5-amino-6-(5-phosphoribosylamino)uracil reductase RibD [Gammaproteobacteria bacterium]
MSAARPGTMFSAADHHWMGRALALARRGTYSAAPNPRVGCVVVAGDEVVGEGWHERTGGPHAEIVALRSAGDRAEGATVYVTLEPCSHHGRTPPCTDALVAAGVARVVAAMKDPNPRVNGGGLARLAGAGIQVGSGLLESAAVELNAGFVSRMALGRPRTTVKLAASLDGRTAVASGESKWITGAAAREDVQRLRAESCAVVTGIGTVLADDPRLDVRLAELDTGGRAPARVVLDGALRTPPGARLFSRSGPVILFAGRRAPADRRVALEAAGAEILQVPEGPLGLDLAAVLAELARRECNEILVEAGPAVAGAFVSAGLADRLVVYLAPVLLGDEGRGMFRLPGIEGMDDRLQLKITDVRQVGDDLRITAAPQETQCSPAS